MWPLLVAAASAFALEMSEEEMAKTGIGKLSFEERSALEHWIEERRPKKSGTQNKKTLPILQEIIKGGRFIRLSDHSLWEIHLEDTPITQAWITPNEIKTGSSRDETYNYLLTNSLTGSSVRARKAETVK